MGEEEEAWQDDAQRDERRSRTRQGATRMRADYVTGWAKNPTWKPPVLTLHAVEAGMRMPGSARCGARGVFAGLPDTSKPRPMVRTLPRLRERSWRRGTSCAGGTT
jgi:hypothetical protein